MLSSSSHSLLTRDLVVTLDPGIWSECEWTAVTWSGAEDQAADGNSTILRTRAHRGAGSSW